MVDEWPLVRKKITSYEHDVRAAEGAARAPQPRTSRRRARRRVRGPKKEDTKGEFSRRERAQVFGSSPGRAVRKLIDLSCLGEFETCKALFNLVNLGYLRAVAPPHAGDGDERLGRASARTWSMARSAS